MSADKTTGAVSCPRRSFMGDNFLEVVVRGNYLGVVFRGTIVGR